MAMKVPGCGAARRPGEWRGLLPLRRPRYGLSMLELLLAVAILAILSGGAYMMYSSFIEEGRVTTTRANLRKVSDAIQSYNSQHLTPYHYNTVDRLVGRYLVDMPLDGWNREMLVDYFFGRVISLGENGELETLVPYNDIYEVRPTSPFNDDQVTYYLRGGSLMVVRADTKECLKLAPDGSMPVIVASNVKLASMAPGASTFFYTDAADAGHVILPGGADATVVLTTTAGTYDRFYGSCFRGDGFVYAVSAYDGTTSALCVAYATGTQLPTVVWRWTGNVELYPAWGADGSTIYFATSGGAGLGADSVYRVAAAPGTVPTTFYREPSGHTILSLSISSDGRYMAVQFNDGITDKVRVLSVRSVGSMPVVTEFAGKCPAFSPASPRSLLYADTSGDIHGIMLSGGREPFLVTDSFSGGDNVALMEWR